MKKALLWVLGIFVILAVAVFLFKNWILKTTLEAAVAGLTGFETKIEALRYDLPATLEINGLTIHNPAGFQNKIFARIPEIYMDLSLKELLRKERVHLRGITLNIEEVNVEKNAQGKTNVSLLSSVGGDEKKEKSGYEKTGPPAPGLPFLLDRLELTLRAVTFEDHSQKKFAPSKVMPGKAKVDMKIEKQVFKNIQNPKALVNLVLLKIVYGTTFGNLLDLSPDKLERSLTGALDSGTKLLTDTVGLMAEKAGDFVSGAADKAGREAQGLLSSKPLADAKGAVTDAAQAAKGQISSFVNRLKS